MRHARERGEGLIIIFPNISSIFLLYEICWWKIPKSSSEELKVVLKTITSLNISGSPKEVAQLLVGHNFKTACKISTKLHTTFSQHVLNHLVNLQSKWTINVEITVASKLGVKKSNIVDTSNIGCVLYALCMVYC